MVVVVIRVSWGKTYGMSNRGVGKEAVVRRQGGVRDRPLTKGKVDSFVVFPVIRIAGVVHLHLEVLGTREEEVAIV